MPISTEYTMTNGFLKDMGLRLNFDGKHYYFTTDFEKNVQTCRRNNTQKYLEVDRVVFNDPATIVFWKDGTKTVVKCAKGTKFNKYAGFCAAVTKRVYENNNLINRFVENGFDEGAKKAKNAASKPEKAVVSEKKAKKEKK